MLHDKYLAEMLQPDLYRQVLLHTYLVVKKKK